jgi:phage FluMu protein Com
VRCVACNKILNDYELTRKFTGSGEFVDLCNGCGKFLIEDDVTLLRMTLPLKVT